LAQICAEAGGWPPASPGHLGQAAGGVVESGEDLVSLPPGVGAQLVNPAHAISPPHQQAVPSTRMARKTRAASAEWRRPEHCVRSNMVRVLRKRYSADECTNEVTGMDVTALVIAIIGATTGVAGVVTAVISI